MKPGVLAEGDKKYFCFSKPGWSLVEPVTQPGGCSLRVVDPYLRNDFLISNFK